MAALNDVPSWIDDAEDTDDTDATRFMSMAALWTALQGFNL